MKILQKFLGLTVAIAALAPACAFSQSLYYGNQSTGFGSPLGKSTLSITDNASTGVISFNLSTGNGGGFNDIAFYISTGSGTETSTADITDTGDNGRRSISGNSPTTGRTLVNFASGFSAKYGVALDANGNANLFQIVPGQGYLTYISGANSSNSSAGNYSFSLTEAQLGLNAGQSFSFVATLSNANSDGNGGIFRSNETIGASNVDNNTQGNLGSTGTLTYSGFDTYTTAVPEPATWLAGVLIVTGAGSALRRTRRRVA